MPDSEKIEESEIFGKYVANFGEEPEYIELKSDTTYVHYTKIRDGLVFIEEGFWMFQSKSFDIPSKSVLPTPGLGHVKILTYCKDNRISFSNFVRRTPEILNEYRPLPEGKLNTSHHTWGTCLFKFNDTIIIVYDMWAEQYYTKETINQ